MIHSGNYCEKEGIIYIPLYMTQCLLLHLLHHEKWTRRGGKSNVLTKIMLENQAFFV